MSTDFEDQLRADLGQVTVRPPRPGLARDAYRRYHQGRKHTRIALAATGTAAAVAGATAGVVASGAPAPATPAGGAAVTTAYVVSRATSAISSVNAVEYATWRVTGPVSPALHDYERVAWQYGDRGRVQVLNAPGQPATDTSSSYAGGQTTASTVDYASRSWSRTVTPGDQLAQPTAACGAAATLLSVAVDRASAADWAATIQAGLKCGTFTVAGRARVDGTEAIKLTTAPGAVTSLTLWVDARRYLPVRADISVRGSAEPGPDGKPVPVQMQTDFQWLAPTSANLAQLTAPVPAGFRFLGTKPGDPNAKHVIRLPGAAAGHGPGAAPGGQAGQ